MSRFAKDGFTELYGDDDQTGTPTDTALAEIFMGKLCREQRLLPNDTEAVPRGTVDAAGNCAFSGNDDRPSSGHFEYIPGRGL